MSKPAGGISASAAISSPDGPAAGVRAQTLAGYARSFNADPNDWKFLTGDLTYITYIGREGNLLEENRPEPQDAIRAAGGEPVILDPDRDLPGDVAPLTPDEFRAATKEEESLVCPQFI